MALDLATESSQATSIAVVSLDDEGAASYTFHFADTANFGWQYEDLPTLAADDWLHIASLACVVSPGGDVLLDWARRAQPCGISYDINVRPVGDRRPGGVLGEGASRGCGSSASTGASSRPATSTSDSWPRRPGVSADPVEVMADWVEQYGYRARGGHARAPRARPRSSRTAPGRW